MNYKMSILLSTSVALLAGLLMTRLFKKLKLPAVTAYLIAGLIVGPYLLGGIDFSFLNMGFSHIGFSPEDFGLSGGEKNTALELFGNVALGFIAFAIGNEFRVTDLKAIGKQAFVIGILQAVAATVLVDIALVGLHFLMPN